LPIISEMIAEYDTHAIAAAALQIAYDQTRPAWLLSGVDLPVEESPTPKPRINKRRIDVGDGSERESERGGGLRGSGGGRGRSSWSKEGKGNDERRSNGGGSPKPKLRTAHGEVSPTPSNHKLSSHTSRE
jgi:ATP-dependent RNA helicase DeaD